MSAFVKKNRIIALCLLLIWPCGAIYGVETDLEKATALEKKKSYAQAGHIWKSLLTKEPDNAYYLYKLGRIYAFTGRYTEAEKLLTRSLEINPKDGDVQLSLAYLYFWTGREDKAQELFKTILKEYPHYTDAQEGLEKIAQSVREKEKERKEKEIKQQEKQQEEEKPPEAKPEFAPWQAKWIKVAERFEKRKRYNQAILIWNHLFDTINREIEPCPCPTGNGAAENALIKMGVGCFDPARLVKASEAIRFQEKECAFHLGQLYAWKGEWRIAQHYLQYALSLDAKYDPAWLRLGYVALFSGHYLRSKEIFWGLMCRDLKKPDPDAVEGYARATQSLINNWEARRAYSLRTFQPKPTFFIFRQRCNVLKWTNPWLKVSALYAQERETDLVTKVPSAERETWFGSVAAHYPLNDQSRLFVSGYGGVEKEINLVADENNFNIAEWKYGLGYDKLINPWLTLRSWCDIKSGEDIGSPIFPLGRRQRFEPGAILLYSCPNYTASVAAIRDSFVVKEFSKSISTFLPRDTFTGQTEYGFYNSWIYTGLLGFYCYYHDRPLNRQWEGQGWVTAGYPRYDPCLFVHYKGRVSGFKFTETDYYSYSRQWEHFAKIYLLKETNRKSEVEMGYLRSWQWSRDLNQPINTAVFVPKLFRITNRAYFEMRHLYCPNINLILRTEYYIDTTQYTAWVARGEIHFIF